MRLGGRAKGTTNKRTEFRKKLEDLYNDKSKIHPLDFLQAVVDNDWVLIGMSHESDITLDQRIDAARTLVPYLVPKLAAITHTVSKNEKIVQEVEALMSMTPDMLEQEAQRLVGIKLPEGIELLEAEDDSGDSSEETD